MCLKSVYAATAHICTKCTGRPCLKVRVVLAFRPQVAFQPQVAFHMSVTSFTMATGPYTICPLFPFFRHVSPYSLLLTSLQLWWAPGCFLRPARPASAFQPCVGFASSTCIASSRILLTHSLTSFNTLRKCYLNIPQPTLAAF